MTWNLALLPRWIPRLPDPLARARLIPESIEPAYDALVFQEVFDRKARALLLAGLAARGYPHHTEVAERGLLRVDTGLLVVSRWPLAAQASQTFTAGRSVDRLARKGALYVTLRKQGWTYHLLATHPQSDVDPSRGNQGVRARQFQQLRAFLDALAPDPEEPVLIVGDLNVDWYADELRATLDTLAAGWPLAARRPEAPVYTFDPRNELVGRGAAAWLDYVLVSRRHRQPVASQGCLHVYRAPWAPGRSDLSDHYAVSCALAFR